VNHHRLILGTAIFAATGALTGCTMDIGSDESFETWNRRNNPAYVDANFEYNAERLPISGKAAQDPIPADYWATYRDSINQRWDGHDSQSPSEKFEQAFGLEGLPDVISSLYGIDKYSHRKECFADMDCDDLEDGSTCARRSQEDEMGTCIPTWWGLCHGWAPYAISEPAAVETVEHNGVTFYPGDIEALFTLVYTKGLPVKFLSERCNEKSPDPDDDGRIPQDECRDMNPGSLHIVATNMLGLREVGFVEDRTYDLQVWNQPVSAYRVTNAEDGKLIEVTQEEAVALVGLEEGSEYTYNTEAKRFFHVKLELDYITEAGPAHHSHVGNSMYTRTDRYEYVLEARQDGTIFGGEYVGASRTFHPDFVWWPTDKPSGRVADGMITYDREDAQRPGSAHRARAHPRGSHRVTRKRPARSCLPLGGGGCGPNSVFVRPCRACSHPRFG